MMKYGIIGALVVTLIGGVIYMSPISSDVQQLLTGTRCLKDTEKAVYEVLKEGRPGKVKVSVVDTTANSTVWSRDFIIPSTTHAYAYDLHTCHFYLHKREGFDSVNGRINPGYFWGLWQYDYFSDTGGRKVVLFAENTSGTREESRVYYGTGFAIDNEEQFISLERSSIGAPDYALVIKDILTGEDVVTLTLADVLKKYPEAAGSFDVGTWYKKPDGVFLYGDIYDGSRWVALWSIKEGTWEIEIRPTPEDYLPGVERSAPYGNNDHLAYTDVIVWAGGVQEIEDELLNEAIAEGRKKNLFIANLRTGKKITVVTVPIIRGHRFDMTWLSDTELEYTMPDGTKKTYRVE